MKLFKPATVWGKKSVFAMTPDEVDVALEERARSRQRFYLVIVFACLLWALVMWSMGAIVTP